MLLMKKLKIEYTVRKKNFYILIYKKMKNEDFLEQLILKANPDLDDAGVEMLVWDAVPVLQDRVFTNILAKLTPDQRNHFTNVIDSKDYNSWQAYKYLCSVIPNYENFIWKVYDDFEKMYLKNFKEFWKALEKND